MALHKGDSPALVVRSICARDRMAHPWDWISSPLARGVGLRPAREDDKFSMRRLTQENAKLGALLQVERERSPKWNATVCG